MCPEGVSGFDYVEPFDSCGGWVGGEAVVEKGFEGGGGGVIRMFRDETDEAACWRIRLRL